MLITVRTEGLPKWTCTCADNATVGTVLASFCSVHSLSSKDCHLFYMSDALDPELKVQESVSSLQQLHKGKVLQGKPVVMTAVICPTIAYLVWHTFNYANVMAEGAIYVDWVTHLDMLTAKDQRFTRLFADKQLLSSFLELSSTATICREFKPLPKDVSSLQSLTVEVAAQPIVHLLHELVSGRAKESTDAFNEAASSTPASHAAGASAPGHNTTPPESSLAEAASDSTSPGHLVVILRSLILLVKLISLLEQSTVKDSREVRYAKGALHLSLKLCHHDLRKHHAGHCASAVCYQSQRSALVDSEEEQCLAASVVQLVLPLMQQAMTLKKTYLAECCCMLFGLLPEGNAPVYKAVAAELLKPGCLKLLATALDGKKKHVAEPVVHTFYSLMNTEHLSAQQRSHVKKLLAQLHGMRRCSVMLCPLITAAELKQLPGALNAYSKETLQDFVIDTRLTKTETADQLGNLHHVAILLDDLWQSPGTSQAASHPCQLKLSVSSACHVTASLAVSQTTSNCKLQLLVSSSAEVHVQISILPAQEQPAELVSSSDSKLVPSCGQTGAAFLCWPTPTAAAWADVVLVVTRVALLLEWMQGRCGQMHSHLPGFASLKQALVKLLCKLLLGHLSNLKLDVHRAFFASFVAIMHEMKGDPALEDLGSVLMQRFISDSNLLSEDSGADSSGQFLQPDGILAVYDVLERICNDQTETASDAAPTLAAAEVLCLLSAFKPQCQQLLEGHIAVKAHLDRGEFDSCANIWSRLKTSPARLNVLSCYARMYEVLLHKSTSLGLVQSEDLLKAKDKALVLPLLHCIRKAIWEDNEPWSDYYCLTITRVLLRYNQLFVSRTELLSEHKGELAVLLIFLVLKLPSVAGTSQPQLLHACLQFAESLLDSLSDLHDDDIAATPEMARDLVDRIDWVLTASAAPARPADRPQHLGLQKCPPGKVQTSYLAVLLHVCCLTNSWAGFGLRAFPKWVYLWKVAVKQHVWVPHPEGKKTALQEDSLTEDRIRSKLPHGILIYIRMVADIHQHHTPEGSLSEETLSAAVLCLLWTLSVSVAALAHLQEDSKAVNKATAQTRAAAVLQSRDRGFSRSVHNRGSADAADMAVQETTQALLTNLLRQATLKEELTFLKGIADTTVTGLKRLRGDSRWAGAIIAFEEGRWCTQAGLDKTATVQQLRSRLAKLSTENWLPPAKLLWIEELLSGSPSLGFLHADESVVAEQLVAEESQAAARAAAKKAKKKQRQKTKRAQAAEEGAAVQAPDEAERRTTDQADPSSSADPFSSADDTAHAVSDDVSAVLPATPPRLRDTPAAVSPVSPDNQAPGQHLDGPNLAAMFNCPLTKVLMVDPVIAADGHTYERAALRAWLQHHTTSPVTGAPLEHHRHPIRPNFIIKQWICCYRAHSA